MPIKKSDLISKLENEIIKKNKTRKYRKRNSIVLDDDFMPYIIPNIYVNPGYRGRFNISEGSETFFQTV